MQKKKLGKGKKAIIIIVAIFLVIAVPVLAFFVRFERGISSYNQGLQLVSQGQYAESLECFERSLRVALPDSRRASALYYLGVAHMELDNFEESITYSLEAEKIYRTLPDADQKRLYELYFNLGFSYDEMGNPDESLAWYSKSLESMEALPDVNQLDKASVYFNMGITYRQQKKHEEAVECLVKSYRIRESELGEEHAKTKKALDELFIVHLSILESEGLLGYLSYDYLDNLKPEDEQQIKEELQESFDTWLSAQLAE